MGKRDGTLVSLLHEQGFGTRKECARSIRDALVEIGYEGGTGITFRPGQDPAEVLERVGLHLRVNGLALPYRETVYVAMHKPAGCECSHAPSHHRSVFSLLPAPLVGRGIQAVGRLDADTTGLLLLSDSGAFNHFFTSPKRQVPKTYRVGTRHPIAPDQVERLSAGVDLRNEEEPTLPATVRISGERSCEIIIGEGRYHQVKRMFAAVGNRVESIHRVSIGGLALDEALAPGSWIFLGPEDLERLGFRES